MTNDAVDDVAYDREVEVEALTMRLADLIQGLLDEQELTRADLARAMGVSRAHITQTLSGQRNLTLRTVAEALYALGRRLDPTVVPLNSAVDASGSSASGFLAEHPLDQPLNVIDFRSGMEQRWRRLHQGGRVQHEAVTGIPVAEALWLHEGIGALDG